MKKNSIIKRILAYTLVLSVIFSQMIFSHAAFSVSAESIEAWDGTKAESFAGGDGTAASPFLIENAAQLYKMVEEYHTYDASYGKYFKITKDIYINDVSDGTSIKDLSNKKNWLAGYGDTIAAASKANSFNGALDGGGNTIYGLYVSGIKNAGLFPAIASYAEIKNLNFDNLLITGGSGYGGAIAGQAIYYAWQSAAKITNCSVTNATIGQWANMEMTGGFIGNINECSVTFTDCYSYGISLSNWDSSGIPGGIVGNAYSSGTLKMINCYSVGYFPTNSNISKAVCTNVYTDTAIPEGNTTANVTVLTSEQMKGEAAKTNMSGLDFKWIWQAVDGGYPVICENPVYVWDGTKAEIFAGGTGTANDPYLIATAEQLAYVVSTNLDDGLYFKLISDIRINDTTNDNWKETAKNWVWADVRFVGNFDGDGHTIDGLFHNGSQKRFGLFSYVGDSLIENFRMTNASITTTTSEEGSGIVSSQASAAAEYRGIYIDETCELIAPNSKGVAGIVARSAYNITISNCAVLAKISGGSHVGAMTGTLWSTGVLTVTDCFTATDGLLLTSGSKTITNPKNNYALVEDAYGTTVLTADQMMGENAKTNMSGLDFTCIWQTVENGYPILRENPLFTWDGTAASSFAGGAGTAEDPYLIENGGQLYKMVADYSNTDTTVKPETHTYFKITKDINLGNNQWYTTGVTSYPGTAYTQGFSGIVYGEGHTIYNLYSNKSSATVGLIPVATQGAEIHDLHLENGNLPKAEWNTYAVGAFIGLAKGASGSAPIVIDGCSVKDFTIASRDASAAFVGYLYSQSVTIKDSYCADSTLSHTAASSANSAAFIGYTGGNDYGNTIIIKNSHSADIYPAPYLNDSFKTITTFENVYTSNETYDNSIDGLVKLTVAEMTGTAVRDNLEGFNFNQIWQYGNDGEYPTHQSNDTKAMYWDGTAAENFAGGEGTEENPYEISNANELYLLANSDTDSTKGQYYKLTNDINISRVHTDWEKERPYSWTKKTAYLDGFVYGNSFAGTLDGAGYTVSGIYYDDEITDNGTYAYGLIPFVSANAVIKNINVESVYAEVEGNAYVGAVAGAAHVTTDDIANPLNMVQFVGVNANDCGEIAVLGGASRGVKFELCNATTLIGNGNEKISVRNCNNEELSYNDDVLIYNSLNAEATALTNIRKSLLGSISNYITEINGDAEFDIRDLVSAKKCLAMTEPEESLVWSQEFNNDTLDYSVWSANTTMSSGTTLEFSESNANVNGGNLTLSCNDTGKTDANGDKIYGISYGLSTIDTMSFKYGRLVMRAKVPFGAGAFPSLWLTSRNAIGYDANSQYSTEIDVFEVFGKTSSATDLVTCIHKWYNEDGVKTGDECSCGTGILAGNGYKVEESDRSYTVSGDAQDEFHTFEFNWDENAMTFSVDGNVYYTANRSEMDNFDLSGYDTDASGIFEQFLCIRLNNHMYTTGEGAAYTYNGDAGEIDASKLNYEIDYIRLYQKNDGKSEINLK